MIVCGMAQLAAGSRYVQEHDYDLTREGISSWRTNSAVATRASKKLSSALLLPCDCYEKRVAESHRAPTRVAIELV